MILVFTTGNFYAQSSQEKVRIYFPNNTVTDVANFYEKLTNKRLIRDSDLEGPNLTIDVGELPRSEAAALIESALLLNGYTIVPVDATTAKLLGAKKQPRNESIPLYASAEELPVSDQVVSFFMPFQFVTSEEAVKIFSGYVTLRPYGSMVAAPNVNALVITENVPLIRRLIALKKVIDVPGGRSVTEFFSLQRADAQKVTEILKMLFDNKENAQTGAVQNRPSQNPEAQQTAIIAPTAGAGMQPAVKIVADGRTNRVMVVAPELEMPYIRQLIGDLDVSVPFEEPYERPLRFVAAGEVLPVLKDLLSEGDVTSATTPEGANPAGLASNTNTDSPQEASTSQGLGGSDSASKPDRLKEPAQNTAPLSIVVGKSRIIADRSSNKIIVIGPPESRTKAARVLDMLDQRPKQIYLATVIGQLTLGDGLNAGIRYPGSVTGNLYIGGGNGGGAVPSSTPSTTNNGGIVNNGGVDIVPGTSQLVNTAINLAAGSLSGLSIYGVIADSIDVTVSALQTTNRFKVISRPVVYTSNNKKAVISSGQEVPIPENSLTSSLSVGQQGTSVASSIGYKNVVLKLEVIPLINSKNEVTLTIAQQNNNVVETVQISDNQVPVISTQELTTTVTVPNRHTIVIGGLITEEARDSKTGLPFLNRIPGLGYLFGSKDKTIIRRELIIMIQPFIIETSEELHEANYVERANSSFTNEDLYDGKVPVKRALLPDPKPVKAPAIPLWPGDAPNLKNP